MTRNAAGEDRPSRDEVLRLTDHEADIASRWFTGAATEDELREVFAAQIGRLKDNGLLPLVEGTP